MPHVWAVPAMKQQPNALRRLVTSHRLKAVVEEAEGQTVQAEPSASNQETEGGESDTAAISLRAGLPSCRNSPLQ